MDIQILASSSKGNCYRVTDGSTQLLLECGIPWKEIQRGLGYKTSEIAGCLITHSHGDHAKAAKDVIKAGLDCCMSAGTAQVIGCEGHRVKIVQADKIFNIGTWRIFPFKTEHDAADPLGYLFYSHKTQEELLFATDTYYIRYRFPGLNYIMVECNYAEDILAANVAAGRVPQELRNRLIQSHFSLANVKEFLQANDMNKVRAIYLIHLSDGNSDAARFKREIAELTGKPVYVAGENGGLT